jgi:glycosyltransferase involved in cell wall biosynthesis
MPVRVQDHRRTPRPGAAAMIQKCVALLGRRDEPTDAIEEYCQYLSAGLRVHDFQMEIVRVAWKETGWRAALRELRARAREWRGIWVMAQFTALAWSQRGFPFRFLRALQILRGAGARIGVVYHDVEPYTGTRIVDRLRRNAQIRTLRGAARYSDLRIFTVEPGHLSWRPGDEVRTTCIPVGANFPDPHLREERPQRVGSEPRTVAVFGITGGEAGSGEVARIADAMRGVAKALGRVRLVAFGRNSKAFEMQLQKALRGTAVESEVLGVLPAENVVSTLCHSDVLLVVRGAISTRRGSAIAGIACGLPVVAYASNETTETIREAGVALYEAGEPIDLVRALTEVLRDPAYRAQLAARSREAQKRTFSWSAIAARYAEELRRATWSDDHN